MATKTHQASFSFNVINQSDGLRAWREWFMEYSSEVCQDLRPNLKFEASSSPAIQRPLGPRREALEPRFVRWRAPPIFLHSLGVGKGPCVEELP
jgi:hypothetical protein